MENLKQKIGWEIIQSPMLAANGKSYGTVAMLRSDNQSMLGVVSNKYKAITNSQTEALALEIADKGNFTLEGFDELRGGRLIIGYLKNNEKNLQLAKHSIKEYLVMANSHDGSKPFYIGTATHLLRCENLFYSTFPIFKKKHNSEKLLDTNYIQKILSYYQAEKKFLYANIAALKDKKINNSHIQYLTILAWSVLYPTSKNNTEQIEKSDKIYELRKCINEELIKLGNNAFGLLNGITKFTTHFLGKNNFSACITGKCRIMNESAFLYLQKI